MLWRLFSLFPEFSGTPSDRAEDLLIVPILLITQPPIPRCTVFFGHKSPTRSGSIIQTTSVPRRYGEGASWDLDLEEASRIEQSGAMKAYPTRLKLLCGTGCKYQE
ncbi:hypothetical protein AVEN_52547-1 [Araneus ventricosus]|uniref:Uncharacterized protein n=1 Tax=Araneus ventricosus TaxID=182803 RepID=A0A4Y2T648_ARAVE|nr:hypothetical protein AVEN_52547-1 [Araneus ventricosus]